MFRREFLRRIKRHVAPRIPKLKKMRCRKTSYWMPIPEIIGQPCRRRICSSIVDELGKFLEFAALASRTSGRVTFCSNWPKRPAEAPKEPLFHCRPVASGFQAPTRQAFAVGSKRMGKDRGAFRGKSSSPSRWTKSLLGQTALSVSARSTPHGEPTREAKSAICAEALDLGGMARPLRQHLLQSAGRHLPLHPTRDPLFWSGFLRVFGQNERVRYLFPLSK